MRFMIEIFDAAIADDLSSGDSLWDQYPFEVDGEEVWIPLKEMTEAKFP